ncbi:MAG: hypothetical protein M3T96_10310 [Acidobacteriota bacterium]|nr:hypothetical protein [Acidobacteriota bacterium]
MALQLAGLKTAKPTEIKIENASSIALPKKAEENIRSVIAYLPTEQLRGIEKIKLVDFIKHPQIKEMDFKGDLPGLYHPKVQNKNPWLEVSVGALLQPTESFAKRWMAKSSFKTNVAGLLFSLVGQHYYLTLRHSVKKTNLEPQIRQYAQKNLKDWGERQNIDSKRAKFFKPFQPYMERWAKWLNKKAAAAQKKA